MDMFLDWIVASYIPWAVAALPTAGAVWVGARKVARWTKSKKDDEALDAVEAHPVGGRISKWLRSKSPIK